MKITPTDCNAAVIQRDALYGNGGVRNKWALAQNDSWSHS